MVVAQCDLKEAALVWDTKCLAAILVLQGKVCRLLYWLFDQYGLKGDTFEICESQRLQYTTV